MTGGTLYDAERIGELARYLASRDADLECAGDRGGRGRRRPLARPLNSPPGVGRDVSIPSSVGEPIRGRDQCRSDARLARGMTGVIDHDELGFGP